MTHTYNISGMTCMGCQGKVEKILYSIPGITGVEIDLTAGTAEISMTAHLFVDTLKTAFRDYPKYEISENMPHPEPVTEEAAGRSWFQTYKPVILIFIYITAVSVLLSVEQEHFKLLKAMRIFMSGFFLTFSFFKFLDLKGFADSYRMYDLLARKFPVWGYMYAVLELLLGIAFAVNFLPVLSNWVSLVVLSVSITGVLKSVLNKHVIKCACLGSVFNLPMSTLTIFEDALMIIMSALMLFLMQKPVEAMSVSDVSMSSPWLSIHLLLTH